MDYITDLAADLLAGALYGIVGIALLAVGYYVLDLLTPGHLGRHIAAGNPNACLLAASALVSLGLVMWFAIFFTGAGWAGLVDVAVFGVVAIAAQAVGFVLLDVLVPGDLRHAAMGGHMDEEGRAALHDRPVFHAAAGVAAAVHLAVALVVCASLT